MKSLLIALVALLPIISEAQSDTAIQFTHLVPLPKASKAELFQRAKSFFNSNFLSSKLSLQSADETTGELRGKGVMQFPTSEGNKQFNCVVEFDIFMEVAPSTYLFVASNFVHRYANNEFSGFGLLTSSKNSPVKPADYNEQTLNALWSQAKQEASVRIEPLMDKLKSMMKQSAPSQ